MNELVFILGGARSGKSAYAERRARGRGGSVVFVATATASDDEMARRIAAHRAGRPADWTTIEAPVAVAAHLDALPHATATVIVDCLTLLVSNLLLAHEAESKDAVARRVEAEIDALLDRYAAGTATWLVVSNEVGLGLVPPYPLGRLYRDLLGRVNARVAARADRVYLMVAGLPIDVKRLAEDRGD
jgi:adenosylcobinamide kinase/adenosylcobinamide-phosphate guanylyltransferase